MPCHRVFSQLASAGSLQVSETGVDCVAGLKPLKQAFTQSNPLNFTNADIVNYFVIQKTVDDLPACDVKGMNSSALGLFRCGNVQDITVSFQNYIYIKASYLPEMRKDCVYKLILVLGKGSFDVLEAKCGCPAGKGPHASCKHIGALCYALEEYTRIGKCPEYITFTDKLQSWNKPRPQKLEIITVADLTLRRKEIMQKTRKGTPGVNFDPRPSDQWQINKEAIENFHCDLIITCTMCIFR